LVCDRFDDMLTIIEHKQDCPVAHEISQSIHRRALWRVRRFKGGADVIGDGVWLRTRRKISPPDVAICRPSIAREVLRQTRLPNTSRPSQRQQSCLAKRRPQLDQFAFASKEWW
jgi:hypothetical protein